MAQRAYLRISVIRGSLALFQEVAHQQFPILMALRYMPVIKLFLGP